MDLPRRKNVCLGVFYCPPTSSVALFDTSLDVTYAMHPFIFSQFVLVSDFNVHMLVHSSYRGHIISLSSHFNLSQVVVDSTYMYVMMAISCS